jgi:hypothetical protein
MQKYTASIIVAEKECQNTFALVPTLYCECGETYLLPLSPSEGFVLLPNNLNKIEYDQNSNRYIKYTLEISDEELQCLVPYYKRFCIGQNTLRHLIAPKPYLQKILDDGLLK